jgi:thiamine biosynthesis lipoprotein
MQHRRLFFPFLFALSGGCFLGCAKMPPPETEYVLGTFCSVNLFEKGTPELYRRVFDRLRELEDILSASRDGTGLDRVNKNAGIGPVQVRGELMELLERALLYAEESGGAFDPSVGPLVKLWGIGSEGARVPREEEIRDALKLVNHREIEVNQTGRTVFLRRPGMALDLGGIAKGYAADEVVKVIAQAGVERGIIDLGGNIFAFGERKEKRKLAALLEKFVPSDQEQGGGGFWRVGLQDPRSKRGAYIGVLRVKNKSVVTSGVYERYFEEGGKRYHHILSTTEGYPVENGLLSVTVIADHSADADALSTAAFALGWEKGRRLIESVSGAAGIFVFDDLGVRLSAGLGTEIFTLNAAEYRLLDQR